LRPSFWETAETRRATLDSKSLDAWDLTIQGQYQVNKRTIDGFLKGVEFFDAASDLDSKLVAPVSGAAEAWLFLAMSGWRSEDVNPWERGFVAAEEAYWLDASNYEALVAMSATHSMQRRPDKGRKYASRAIEINPHAANGYHILALSLTVGGNPEESIPASTQAGRLGRYEPWHHDTASDLAYSHYLIGNYEAALTWGQQSLQLFDRFLQVHIILAATYAQLGRTDEGQPHVETVLKFRPDFSCAKHKSCLIYAREKDRDHIIAGLLKAGLPE